GRVVKRPHFHAEQVEHHRQRVGGVAVVVQHQRAGRLGVPGRAGRDGSAAGVRGRGGIVVGGPRLRRGHAAGRQPYAELGALAGAFAVHLYDAAVHFHQLPYQGQADAQPAARALERAVGLHEQLEDLARLRLVEADAAVADTDVDLVADAGLEHDPAAWVRVLRGVVQQVGE